MALYRILEYKQKDGRDVLKAILNPSKAYPKGSYYYADAEDIALVEQDCWHVMQDKYTRYVSGRFERCSRFHQCLMLRHGVTELLHIDHLNHCGFDNCMCNLKNVTPAYNTLNRMTWGYKPIGSSGRGWRAKLDVPNYISDCASNEVEACQIIYDLEQQYLPYHYNFLEDMSNDIDILDLERTGQISHEEAVYRHVKRYSNNAWYYYRFNLEEYYRDYNLPIPQFSLDKCGAMICDLSGRRLCPYFKELRVPKHNIEISDDLMDNVMETFNLGIISCISGSCKRSYFKELSK